MTTTITTAAALINEHCTDITTIELVQAALDVHNQATIADNITGYNDAADHLDGLVLTATTNQTKAGRALITVLELVAVLADQLTAHDQLAAADQLTYSALAGRLPGEVPLPLEGEHHG